MSLKSYIVLKIDFNIQYQYQLQSNKFFTNNTMTKPLIADTKPQLMTLKPGKYYWCSCGSSSKQPFCDGSHQGTSFTPMEFTITEEKKVAMCLCKDTKNTPFCDGSHASL